MSHVPHRRRGLRAFGKQSHNTRRLPRSPCSLAMTHNLYTQKPPAGRPRVLLEQDKSFGVQDVFYQIVCNLGRECYTCQREIRTILQLHFTYRGAWLYPGGAAWNRACCSKIVDFVLLSYAAGCPAAFLFNSNPLVE